MRCKSLTFFKKLLISLIFVAFILNNSINSALFKTLQPENQIENDKIFFSTIPSPKYSYSLPYYYPDDLEALLVPFHVDYSRQPTNSVIPLISK